jgi:hypothetical protein
MVAKEITFRVFFLQLLTASKIHQNFKNKKEDNFIKPAVYSSIKN